jgi:hypothetical protein
MSNTFKSVGAKNVVTSGNTIYTVPAATQTVGVGLVISNTGGTPIAANVAVTRSAVNYYIVNSATIPVGGSLVVAGVDQKLVLQASDSVLVTASANNSADVWLSVLEIA